MIEMVPISDGASLQMNNPFNTASLCCDMNTDICSAFLKFYVYTCSVSAMFHSLKPHGLWPARLLCPWDSPDKNTGVWVIHVAV